VGIGPAATSTVASGRDASQRTLFAALVASLALMSWVALAAWSASPYARYMEHGGWGDATLLAALCRAVPGGNVVVPAAVHALGWVLMITAMMLPTTWPILSLFRSITRARSDSAKLATLIVLGFFVAWFGFGIVAHAADELVRALAQRSGFIVSHGWAIGAVVLAGAGLFQFSALKYRCLEQCHTPFGFIVARWHGVSPPREAFRLGLDHGLFCVGCCWALMLVMFVVGTGSVAWMLAIAAVMAAEKNLPWGRRLRTPLGLGLLGWAAVLVVRSA
jgi:predicted metal-binding membrane protein